MTLNFVITKQLLVLRQICLLIGVAGQSLMCVSLNAYSVTFFCRLSLLVTFTKLLRFHYYTRVQQLSELTCVDWPMLANRFRLSYLFLSCFFNYRLQVAVLTNGFSPVASLVSLFAGSAWQEREAWDMFGVLFSNNPDLRRILTDYGFLGHPLRKDFPLSGFVEASFNDMTQLVTYQPLSLAQEFRDFARLPNPWVV